MNFSGTKINISAIYNISPTNIILVPQISLTFDPSGTPYYCGSPWRAAYIEVMLTTQQIRELNRPRKRNY